MKADASPQRAKKRKKPGANPTPARAPNATSPPKAASVSAESTKPARPAPVEPPAPIARPAPLTSLTNTQIWLLGLFVTIVAMGALGYLFGPPSAVLALTAYAFISVIALFWTSLRTLLGETPLEGADAFAIGAPRVEEEQKRAVLRALKDLEFERSVGKISDDDYKQLVTQYREEAKRLLRRLDEQGAANRRRAEMLVAERFVVKAPVEESDAKAPESDEDEDGDEDAAPLKTAPETGAVEEPSREPTADDSEEDEPRSEEHAETVSEKAGRDAP